MTKQCNKCDRELPVEDFARDASKRCGRKSLCRRCDRLKAADYYRRNRPERLAKANARNHRLRKEAPR